MMRCIQEAVKNGELTRRQGEQLQERVDAILRAGIGPEYMRPQLAKQLAAEAQEAKRRALLMEGRRKILTETLLNHRNAKGENDPAEALWLLIDDTAQRGVDGIETRMQAIKADVHSTIDGILSDFRKGWLLGDLRRRKEGVAANMENFVREAFGEDTGDARAKELAKTWIEVTNRLRTRANRAGAAINHLENFGFPQGHNREALLNVGREKWVEYMMRDGVLDLERMNAGRVVPMTLDDLRVVLRDVWGTITSGGQINRTPGYGGLGQGALARRWDGRDRWLHFKSADEWLAYQKAFGEGDPYRIMTTHINHMARDIATLEVMGPNPEAMRNYLKGLVLKTAASVAPVESVVKDATVRLRQLVGKAAAGDAGESALGEVERRLSQVARLKRQARTNASGGALERDLAQEAERELRDAVNAIGRLESQASAEQRAAINLEITRLEGMMASIQQKSTPQIKTNVPRRNQKIVDDLRRQDREMLDMIERSRELSYDEEVAIDRILAALRDPSNTVDAADAAYGLLSFRPEIQRRLLSSHRWASRHWPERARTMDAIFDEASNGRIWFPHTVRAKLVEPGWKKSDFVAYLQELRDGGLAAERVRHLEGIRNDIAKDLEKWTGGVLIATGLSRRNQRRAEEIHREMNTLKDRLRDLDLMRGTLQDADPKLWREILQQINTVRTASDHLDLVGDPDGFLAVARPEDAARAAIYKHDNLWELLRGTYFTPVNSWWADALQSARNVMTANKLGSASITALGDMATQRAARRLAGMDHGLGSIISGMMGQWSDAAKWEAVRSGLIADEALHVGTQQARFMEGINTVTWTGYMADRVIHLSGLAWMTQAAKHAFGLELQAFLADQAQTPFPRLPEATQAMFRRNGIGSVDWDMMRWSRMHEPEPGAKFLRPNEIAEGGGGRELAERYMRMILRMTRMAVVEGTPEARVFWGGGRGGTFIGEVSRNMAQFKTFSVSYLLTHLRYMQHTWQAGDKWNAVSHGATLMVFGTALGALSLELSEIARGKDPVLASAAAKGEAPPWHFWGKAFLKSGGAGLLGDFAAAPISPMGGGMLDVLAGPLPGTAERIRRGGLTEIADWAEGKEKNPPASRYAIRAARELAPGVSLWYLRSALERGVFDQLSLAFDKDAERVWRRQKQINKKLLPNDYYWPRGQLTPDRLPGVGIPR